MRVLIFAMLNVFLTLILQFLSNMYTLLGAMLIKKGKCN